MDLQEVEGGCGDWMELAQDRDRWRALVSTVMNLRAPKKRGISWLAAEPVSFWRWTLLHGVSKYVYICCCSSYWAITPSLWLHSDTSHSVEILWTSDQPNIETSTWQHATLARDNHASSGIWIHNPSKRAAPDPRLKLRGHWDGQNFFNMCHNSVLWYLCINIFVFSKYITLFEIAILRDVMLCSVVDT